MVSYYNPLAMYRHQQQTTQCAPGTATWYPQPPQHPQYITSCMSDVDPHTVGTHWPSAETHKFLSPHHPAFPADWPQDCNHFQQPSPPISDVSSPGAEGLTTPTPVMIPERPVPVRSPYEWMKKTSYQSQPNPGKTRTKDKYRVVYTDHQRLELEKEFHYSRYITIRRKAELANNLGLSERQVKIWFQNRRAKERKIVKKKMECPNLRKEVDLTGPVGIGIPSSPLHHMQNGVTMPGGMPLM